jgi:ABC-type glycerol-3-phosphate transport system substrate-binding protein
MGRRRPGHGRAAGLLALGLACAGLAAGMTACGDGDDGGDSSAPSGEITVLTQRTDLVDNVFLEYKKTFEALYPDVTVKFEALAPYEDEIRIRMNTEDYGDVLLIPGSVSLDQQSRFFEPLGDLDTMKQKYRFMTEHSYEGKVYGMPLGGNATVGFVYNKKIWAKAGLTAPPATPEAFLAALKAIKDKTDAIPLYTNYRDGWPVTTWEGARGAVSNNPDAFNQLADTDAPWAPGEEHYVIDSLLWDAVNQGLTEPDPTTTNWEESKNKLGTGKIGMMMLGSWAISQMQAAADDPADIGYLPFPVQVDGAFHAVISGDYANAINIHSKHKAAARAWIDWFAEKSNYAADQGGLSPVQGGPMPATLADFDSFGVKVFELTPQPAGKEGLVTRIDKAAEIGLSDPPYRQRIIDAARGAKKETKQAIFDDLNKKWADARKNTQ